MSDERFGERDGDAPVGDDDGGIRALLEAAGARPEVPPEELLRLRAAARAEWERLSRPGTSRPASARRSLPRQWLPALLAASLLVALALGWRAVRTPPADRGPVATIDLLRGDATFDPPPGGEEPGRRVAAGSWIETGGGTRAGRLALRLAGGGSLRFDVATRARLASAERIELERGALYFDSSSVASVSRPIEIATPFGVVREIGTQFAVRLGSGAASGLEVGVREGRVVLAPAATAIDSGAQSAEAGEWLALRADGSLSRRRVASAAPEWEWVVEATPAPEIEGRTLRFLLDWACRESGWELRFEDRELEREAETIVLHGTVEGLRPGQAVDVGLAGAGLARRLEERALIVTRLAPD